MQNIVGFKGASSGGSSPTEAPDSLLSTSTAKILDLLSEGEIAGLVDGLKSVYLDGTPIENADGTQNYTGVTVDSRPGTQDQEYISGFPSVDNEHAVGFNLRSDNAWIQALSDLDLSAVRVRLATPSLQQTNNSTGDITGYRIEYAIDLSTDGGGYQQVLSSAFDGKTTSTYERSHRIDLPIATVGWVVRVRRITVNANSSYISDSMTVEAYSEVIDAKLRHPMSALVGIQFDAAKFSSVPPRAYDTYGRIIRVPSNYDVPTRTYTGIWDGTFKLAWSDNPAWVFYDLVLNDRYGLGDTVDATMVDRWSLYQIAQYCDGMVPDGMGGTEPRFTCNLYLQTRQDAYKVLQDIASVFQGMAYWGSIGTSGPSIIAVSDRPQEPVYTYSQANVIDGKFEYQGSGLTTRYTVALVSWSDPQIDGKQGVEYVPDRDGIERYGIVQTEITAVGCTSQGQAQRVGRWALVTSRLETQGVSFSVGLDGTLAAPGQVVAIVDPKKAGRRIGGRISNVSGRVVTLDAAVQVVAGDTLRVNLPTGVAQTVAISAVDGRKITVAADWAIAPASGSVWSVESTDLKTQLYRIHTVTEGGGLQHDITATQYEAGKFDNVDFETRIDPRPTTVLPSLVQAGPADVTLSTYNRIDQGISETVMVISWGAAKNAVTYTVEWKKDGGDWVPAGSTGTLQVEVAGIYAGSYIARVKAVNVLGVSSLPSASAQTDLAGNTTPPPAVTNLTTTSLIFGIQLDWGFPDGPNTVQRTEIWYSETDDRTAAIKLGDFAYPQNTHTMMGLAAGTEFYFWTRLVDKIGNVGAWFPIDADAGVVGQASSSAAVILQYLLGQITDSQLGAALLTKINAGAGASVSVYQVVSELAAMYTIKTQFVSATGRTYIAGIGVGVENDDGVIESQVLVAASRFAVIDPNGTTVGLPFVIQGGQVFIDQAFIQDASIGSAKIADIIQSDNYVAGVSGWKIDKAGAIEVNNLTARGNITADSVTANSISTNGLQLNSVTTMASWSGLGTFAYSGSGGDVLVVASVTGTGETGGAVNFSIDGDVFTVAGPPGSTTSVVKRYSAWNGAKSLQAYAPNGGTGPITDISLAVLEAKR